MADMASVSRSMRRHAMATGLASVVLLAGVGGWAAATTLSGAVVTMGSFVVETNVKLVQHPEGGVVGELLVQEGDEVKAGQVLVRLDATQTRANLAIVAKRLDELLARQARLEAERDGLEAIVFPPELTARPDNADVAKAMTSEQSLFGFRRETRHGLKAQLAERIIQYGHEIEGLAAQQDAFEHGLDVLDTEIEGLRDLYQRNLVSLQRLNALEREAASLGGEHGEVIAARAQASGRIAEARLQVLQVDNDLKTEVGAELRDVQAQIGEFLERRIAAEDALKRIDIVAPQDGYVHELILHTVGGVVPAGDALMQVVPKADRLALDVRVSPRDIDQIHLHQTARLRLSAFNQRTTPELAGTVIRVAADLTQDRTTGASYYLVRIAVPQEQLARLDDLTLVPGMPAEAFIQTGERTALSYFIKPFTDQMSRAFREE